MTLTNTTFSQTFQGNGATTVFNYNFPIPLDTYVVAIYTDPSGVSTTLTPNLYTITGLGNPSGGTITYPLAGSPMATGATLMVSRILPLVQLFTLANQGGFYPDVVDGALDYITMVVQQIAGGTVTLNNANLTGVPTAPTAAANTNTQQVATTAFVTEAVAGGIEQITLTGDVTGTGSGTVATTIANGAVTTAKLADTALKAIAPLTPAANTIPYYTGGTTGALADFTVAGRTLVAAADAATQRAALGLGSAAVLTAGVLSNNAVQLDGSAKLPAVDGSQLTNLPNGWTQIGGTTNVNSGTSVAITSIPSGYQQIWIRFNDVTGSAGSANITLALSSNNGSGYGSAIVISNTTIGATYGFAYIDAAGVTGLPKTVLAVIGTTGAGGGVDTVTTGVINAFRIAIASGAFNGSGTITVWGVK